MPNKIDVFIKMRSSVKLDEVIINALRIDDVNTLQLIVANSQFSVSKFIVPYSILDEFVINGQTNYLDYSVLAKLKLL